MMEHRIIKGTLIVMVLFTSCYYDVEEILYPDTGCVTTNMSLQNNIVPILDRNCYTCHSTVAGFNNGNVVLEGYTELIKYVNNGKLLGALRNEPGFEPMPQNAPRLGDCEIAKIDQWIKDGFLNN